MNDQDKTKPQLIEELAELRRSFDALINYLPEGFFVVNYPQVKILFASRFAQQMLGATKEELEKVEGEGHFHYYQAFHPDGAPAKIEELPLARSLNFGEVIRNEEWLMQTRDGQCIPIFCHSGPVRDAQGTIIGAVISWQDITDRKRAEESLQKAHDELEQRVEQRTAELTKLNESLRQSHDELQTIYDGMFDGIAILDIETERYLRVNASICRMLGYSEEELLSMSLADIHHPDELDAVKARIRERIQGSYQGSAQDTMLKKDGGCLKVDIVCNSLFYQGRQCIAGFFRDIGERIRAENEIRDINRRLINTLESITDGFTFIDRQWRFHYVNAAAARYVRKTLDKLLGKVCWEVFPEAKSTKFYTEFHRAMEENIPVHFEVFYPPLHVWYEVSCYPSPEGISVYFRDVSPRKRAEDERQREFRTLKHLLQSSDHERQTIAYEIHDGLAQYLAAAIMQFDVYKHKRENKPADAAKAFEAGMTMLKQSHFESRRLIAGVRPPVLDEAGVVEAIAHLINEHNREKGPKIRFNSEVEFSRLVSILENAIYRICQEGLSNARKHSHSEKVSVSLRQRSGRLRIEIRDWGSGFNPHKVKADCYGLVGIRQRVRLLGGKCHIQSSPGNGTRIRVELPLMEKEE